MRDPYTASFAHQSVQSHCDPAGCRFHLDAAVRIAIMEVGLAVGHDHEGANRVWIEFACPSQPAAKQNRSDELVDRNQRHEQQLHLRSPPRKLGGDDRGKSEGNAGLRHQSGPRIRADRLGKPGRPDSCCNAKPDECEPDGRHRDRAEPDGRHRIEPKRGTDRHEIDHQYRRRSAVDGGSQGVPLRDRQVLDDHASSEGSQERLELLGGADLYQDGAHRQQHERDFTADVAQVEREQHADENTKGDRPSDFPGQSGEYLCASSFSRVEHDARQEHRHREQNEDREVGEHDDRQYRVAESPTCP
jgi:hypothetical protein